MEGITRSVDLMFRLPDPPDLSKVPTIEDLHGKDPTDYSVASEALLMDIEFYDLDDPDLAQFYHSFVPEIVTRHPGFYKALATVDLRVVGSNLSPGFEPHQRRFNLLDDVTFMVGKEGHLLGFDVPPLGCEFMREDMYNRMSMCVDGMVRGNSVDVCYGARPKLDGYESVCFRVKYEHTDSYVLWDDVSVRLVKASQPFHAEKVGGIYYILSPIIGTFSLTELDGTAIMWMSHDWSYYSRTLYETCEEGIVFNVNFREYKVVKVMSFTYKVDSGFAYDSTTKLSFQVDLPNGCWDLALDCDISKTVKNGYKRVGMCGAHVVYMIKKRLDRIYGDSHQQISVSRDKCIRYDSLLFGQVLERDNVLMDDAVMSFRLVTDDKIVVGDIEESTTLPEWDPKVKNISNLKDVKYARVKDGDIVYDVMRKHDMAADIVVGDNCPTVVSERAYFQNSREMLLVASFIVQKKKEKNYVSWGDCFLRFRESMLLYSVSVRGRQIRYSGEFGLSAFFKYCIDRYLYLKDGMAYNLCLHKKLLASGFTMNVYRKKLIVSKTRRKDGQCFSYRQFYVWYADGLSKALEARRKEFWWRAYLDDRARVIESGLKVAERMVQNVSQSVSGEEVSLRSPQSLIKQ